MPVVFIGGLREWSDLSRQPHLLYSAKGPCKYKVCVHGCAQTDLQGEENSGLTAICSHFKDNRSNKRKNFINPCRAGRSPVKAVGTVGTSGSSSSCLSGGVWVVICWGDSAEPFRSRYQSFLGASPWWPHRGYLPGTVLFLWHRHTFLCREITASSRTAIPWACAGSSATVQLRK